MRAGHSEVGDVGRAAGQDPFIGRLHVRVGSDDGRDPAVQVPAHGDAVAGGLGVDFDEDEFGLRVDLVQHLVDGVEGAGGGFHERAAEKDGDGEGEARLAFEDGPFAADGLVRQIGRSQQAVRFGEQRQHLFLPVDVVAEGHDVDAHRPEFVEDGGGDAGPAGGVLGVDDDHVDRVRFQEAGERGAECAASGFADDVADEQGAELHETSTATARLGKPAVPHARGLLSQTPTVRRLPTVRTR